MGMALQDILERKEILLKPNDMNEILQQRIEEAVKKTACPQCVFNDGGTCNNDDDCKLFDDFVGLMTFAFQNQWISVKEALPEKNTMCFVRKETKLGIIYDTDYIDYEGKWFFNFNRASIKSMAITHWMSIPELKGGEG